MKARSPKQWFAYMMLLNLMLGIVIGMLIDQYFFAPVEANIPAVAPQGRRPRRRPLGANPRIVPCLAKKLDLSEEQTADLQKIFEEHRAALSKFQESRRSKFRILIKEFHQRIEGILNDEQLARFKELKRRLAQRRRRDHFRKNERVKRQGAGPGRADKRPSSGL